MRWRSAGESLALRSETSWEKSTSSTVQVFLIAALYISKNTGYFIGRSVRLKPGFRIMGGGLRKKSCLQDTPKFDGREPEGSRPLRVIFYWQASQLSGFSREQATASASVTA